MARYTGPVCRLCRREGVKLYLKGEKCYSDKCPIVKRATPPGQHGASRRKPTEYAIQLREKQKARRYYGVLERQFERYFEMASRKKGVTGEVLLQTLERRLDNVVYRMGFAASRAEARQIVKHSHIEVNGRKVNIPSYLVREGDVVAVRESSREHKRIKELAAAATRTVPAWLSVDPEALRGTVLRLPNRDEIDTPVQEQLIVEFYSR
ncbi:30S ribosomal protein S4 [Symbiobacterium thermophilum]|uniref:Small ribosomal subunit protein uS4A n=1 Tax=Symbiobacterium thermophilum (strain DSM 24528 / JCM 14929 / IAM 14863 / T) TaxID=292459 RepID=RS4A_SYMTH|nr:30S ribosomal protein S4 [Symbiobacterium thermophilum]Q67JX0.1 RecName: Full=Small ribosomal subunit protein uS4A; AltName: Full=30S ribosomal protein S4 1 [Symbiobacterium thermophilum IAM 14863]BAD42030.1 30S ribosomal protein S4 [Symbiobacterium thermophilum IAM 14863]